jgi:hypothetical protein
MFPEKLLLTFTRALDYLDSRGEDWLAVGKQAIQNFAESAAATDCSSCQDACITVEPKITDGQKVVHIQLRGCARFARLDTYAEPTQQEFNAPAMFFCSWHRPESKTAVSEEAAG